MSKKKSTPDVIDFEKSLARLNALLETMESGKLTLNESLTCFEEGINLIKQCQQVLSDTEQKITLITDSSKKHD